MTKDRLFAIGMVVVLVVGVLAFVPGLLPFRTNKEFVAEWCIIFFLVLMLKNRWLGAFVLWSTIGVIASTRTPIVGLNKAYILGLHTLVIFALFYQLFFDNFKKKYIDTILNIIAVTCILQVLMQVIQYNGTWFVMLPLHWKMVPMYGSFFLHPLMPIFVLEPLNFNCSGFMDMVNSSSGLLAVCLPVFFRKQWRWGIPFVFVGLWLSRSMGGMFPAVLVTFLYFVIKERKYIKIATISLIVLSVLFFLRYEKLTTLLSGTGRVDLWKAGLKIYWRRPIMGWGIQQANYLWRISRLLMERPGKWIHYHSEFLQVMIEFGAVGIVIVMGYFTTLLNRARKFLSDEKIFIIVLAIMAGLINCLVNFPFHNVIGIVLIVYLAMLDKLTS